MSDITLKTTISSGTEIHSFIKVYHGISPEMFIGLRDILHIKRVVKMIKTGMLDTGLIYMPNYAQFMKYRDGYRKVGWNE